MKVVMYISLLLNILLIIALLYIGLFRTDYFHRVYARMFGGPYIPERVDNDCVASWNNCLNQLDYDADVVFFGNSITEGGNWQKALPGLKVVNMGYVGEDTKGMLRRVNALASLNPKSVFLMAGINDLHSRNIEDFQQNYIWLVDSILFALPGAALYIESILPVSKTSDYCNNEIICQVNMFIRQVAEERKLTYVDLFTDYAVDNALPETYTYDGIHLRESAYEQWYYHIRTILNQ